MEAHYYAHIINVNNNANRFKYIWKECCGKGICDHGRQKFFCNDCKGSQICSHGKQKSHCRDCHTIEQTNECLISL